MDQLTINPEPKRGSVKSAILDYLRGRPDGSCRRDFVMDLEIYEVSARIGELQKDGWNITNRRCSRHRHREGSHFVEYLLT